MNKKILSIFVMVMALSLLGVSCNNKNTTGTGDNNGGGGNTTTSLTLSEINTKIAALGIVSLDANGIASDSTGTGQSFDFSSASGENNTLNVQGVKTTTADGVVSAQKLVDHLTTSLKDVTVTIQGGSAPTSGSTALVVEVSSGENTVTITITPTSAGWKA